MRVERGHSLTVNIDTAKHREREREVDKHQTNEERQAKIRLVQKKYIYDAINHI